MERFQEAKRQTTVVCKHHVIVWMTFTRIF
jgi:hypothetical protein